MIKTKLLRCLTQQVLKQRILQVGYWNHKPLLPLLLPHINCKMPSWNICHRRPFRRRPPSDSLLSMKNHRELKNTHCSKDTECLQRISVVVEKWRFFKSDWWVLIRDNGLVEWRMKMYNVQCPCVMGFIGVWLCQKPNLVLKGPHLRLKIANLPTVFHTQNVSCSVYLALDPRIHPNIHVFFFFSLSFSPQIFHI